MAEEDELEPVVSFDVGAGGEADDRASAPAPAVTVPESSGAVEGEQTPAGLSDEEEVPPDPEPKTKRRVPSDWPLFEGDLPDDILRVWVTGKRPEDEMTARTLIGSWGLEVFRGSEIHKQALAAGSRDLRMEPIREAFIAAQKKKEKK